MTYALAIYHLNLLLAFLTPKIDPAIAEYEAEDADDGMALPTKQTDEFRPFIRSDFIHFHLDLGFFSIRFCGFIKGLGLQCTTFL